MRGHADDDPRKLPCAVDDHLLCKEDPGIEPADLRDAEETLLQLGDHEGDLIHVPREHERRPRAVRRKSPGARDARDAVTQRIDSNVARVYGEPGADDPSDLLLVAGGAARLRELPEKDRGFHGAKIPARSVSVQPADAGILGRRLLPKPARITIPPRGIAA